MLELSPWSMLELRVFSTPPTARVEVLKADNLSTRCALLCVQSSVKCVCETLSFVKQFDIHHFSGRQPSGLCDTSKLTKAGKRNISTGRSFNLFLDKLRSFKCANLIFTNGVKSIDNFFRLLLLTFRLLMQLKLNNSQGRKSIIV